MRSAAEILSTLDQDGTLDGLPFMPEMLKYCGRKWRVSNRADKTCGDRSWGARRMYNTVHLGDLRCDGAAHGGCQAACLMYWKEAWLERFERGRSPDPRRPDGDEQPLVTNTVVQAATNGGAPSTEDPTYRCQATEIPRASNRLRFRQLDQYPRAIRTWGLLKVVRGLAIHAFNLLQSLGRRFVPSRVLIAGGRDYPFIAGKLDKLDTPTAELNLVAGDLVRIKTKREIVSTLDYRNKNQGLSFDKEMLKYCGRVARVRGRVERLIDESTGKMIRIDSDCIILEGVVCKADYHLFCTRSIYPYWREIWLERVAA